MQSPGKPISLCTSVYFSPPRSASPPSSHGTTYTSPRQNLRMFAAAELETQRARVAKMSKSSPPPLEARGACCQAPGTIQTKKEQGLERTLQPTRQDIQVDLDFHFFQDVFETSRHDKSSGGAAYLTTPALISCQPVCSGADAAGTSPDLPAIRENTGTPDYSAVNITQNNEVDTDPIIIALRCASQDRLKSSGTLFPNYEDVTVKAIQPPNDKQGEERWRNLKKGGEMSLQISPKKVEKERRKQSQMPTTKPFDAPKLLQTKEPLLQRAPAPSQPTPAPELLQIQERLAQRASAPMQLQHAAKKSTPNGESVKADRPLIAAVAPAKNPQVQCSAPPRSAATAPASPIPLKRSVSTSTQPNTLQSSLPPQPTKQRTPSAPYITSSPEPASGKADVQKMVQKQGHKIQRNSQPTLLPSHLSSADTQKQLLHEAACRGHATVTKQLIAASFNVDFQDKKGCTFVESDDDVDDSEDEMVHPEDPDPKCAVIGLSSDGQSPNELTVRLIGDLRGTFAPENGAPLSAPAANRALTESTLQTTPSNRRASWPSYLLQPTCTALVSQPNVEILRSEKGTLDLNIFRSDTLCLGETEVGHPDSSVCSFSAGALQFFLPAPVTLSDDLTSTPKAALLGATKSGDDEEEAIALRRLERDNADVQDNGMLDAVARYTRGLEYGASAETRATLRSNRAAAYCRLEMSAEARADACDLQCLREKERQRSSNTCSPSPEYVTSQDPPNTHLQTQATPPPRSHWSSAAAQGAEGNRSQTPAGDRVPHQVSLSVSTGPTVSEWLSTMHIVQKRASQGRTSPPPLARCNTETWDVVHVEPPTSSRPADMSLWIESLLGF